MPRMLKHLEQTPENGLLGYHSYVGITTLMLSGYWRSPEHLNRFASAPDAPHPGRGGPICNARQGPGGRHLA